MRPFIIFATAIAFAAPLQAGTPMQPITASVNTADLDLANSHGQRVLARRVADAVEQVCGSYANAPEQVDQTRISDCRKAAMSDARQQIAGKSTSVRLATTGRR
jgi:UrcA family protein